MDGWKIPGMELSNGKSLISIVHFPLPCQITGGYSPNLFCPKNPAPLCKSVAVRAALAGRCVAAALRHAPVWITQRWLRCDLCGHLHYTFHDLILSGSFFFWIQGIILSRAVFTRFEIFILVLQQPWQCQEKLGELVHLPSGNFT